MERIPKKLSEKGFTLIELMIVVAIIGILSAVAVPHYRNFVTKAKVTEAFYAVTPIKYGLVEYIALNGDTYGLAGKSWSAVLKELGVESNYFGNNSRHIKNAWWNNSKSEIRVSFTDKVPEAQGRYFVMRADMSSGSFQWRCLSSNTYAIALPAEYLPSTCH